MHDRKHKHERDDEQPPAETSQEVTAGEMAQETIEQLTKQRDEYIELARRARADYQNLQRRAESQSAAVRADAVGRMALDMIAVLDDIERALGHAREAGETGGLVEGIALVRENFLAALGRYGIEPIEARGAPFDHNYHHAIAEQPTDDFTAGTVVAVAQAGYMADGKLLRPAQVVVARPLAGEGGAAGAEDVDDFAD